MKNINLLPRKSLWEQYFLPLIIALLLVSVIPVSIASYRYTTNQNEIVNTRGEIGVLNQKVGDWEAKLKPNPVTVDYKNLFKMVQTLMSQRTNWIPIFNLLSEQLPSKALIKDMNVLASNTVTVHYEFYKNSEIIEYITRLQQSPLVGEVKVASIIRANTGDSQAKLGASVKGNKESEAVGVFNVNLAVTFRPNVEKLEGK